MNIKRDAALPKTVVVDTFDQWRSVSRALLGENVAPHDVQWSATAQDGDLFYADDAASVSAPISTPSQATTLAPAPQDKPDTPPIRFPRRLLDMLQSAACFRVADRWAFLYKIVWRWHHSEQEVLSPADTDGNRLAAMVKAVHREEHDMHAYIRFREWPEGAGAPRFVAWFEPSHDVLPQVAAHFARRMGRVTWLIATPDATVYWDGQHLSAAESQMRGPADIADAGEALWLTYYSSIFNPARLNARVMHNQVPSRFWKNLPEGALVPGMISEAAAGARSVGQVKAVGERDGTIIPIQAERAQPQRAADTDLDACRRCDLWQHATQAVPGVGAHPARIMLVGEQPGDKEDLAGLPFIGPAGQLLDEVLAQAGIQRDSVYVTNAVKHFKWEPRGKRRLHKTPGQREMMACRHWLEQELESVAPQVVVTLGSTALRSITNNSQANLTSVLGTAFVHDERWVVPIYHPAYALRTPDQAARREAMDVMVAGLKRARELLGSFD